MPKQLLLGTVLWLCAVSAAGAGSSPDPFSALSKPLPPAKPLARTGNARSNPCASFGPNFRRIEGTDTCVKIGGGVSIEAGSATGR
jgi:hypothetical protein